MYSLDASNTLTEYPNIPLEGGIGNSQSAGNFSLIELNGDLYGWLNDFGNGNTVYALGKFDFTNQTNPTYTVELSERPEYLFDLKLINGAFYYSHFDNTTGVYAFNRFRNGVTLTLASSVISDSHYSMELTYINGELYASHIGVNSVDCSGFSNPGHELHKISTLQLFCLVTSNIDPVVNSNYHGIVAASQTINITGAVTLSNNNCTVLSAPNINTLGNLTVNLPAQIMVNNIGCQ